jgi:hypothetical protein
MMLRGILAALREMFSSNTVLLELVMESLFNRYWSVTLGLFLKGFVLIFRSYVI